MAQIELRRKDQPSLWAEVDDEDLPLLNQYRWYSNAGRGTFYAQASIREDGKRRTIRMHKLLTGNPLTDHVDGNGLNNRRANLRLASTSQNGMNLTSRRGNSKYKGVCYDITNQRWKAYITVEGKRMGLGLHPDEEAAARAYDAAAIAHVGEFAKLNFPKEDNIRKGVFR